MAHPDAGQEVLTLAEAAQVSGVAEEVLRRAMVAGELRCFVTRVQEGLAFVCTRADIASWQGRLPRPRAVSRDTITLAPEEAPRGASSPQANEERSAGGLLQEVAADVVQAARTVESLQDYLAQTAAAVQGLEDLIAQHGTAVARDSTARRVIADNLACQQEAATRALLALGVTQRRLLRARRRLEDAGVLPAQQPSPEETDPLHAPRKGADDS